MNRIIIKFIPIAKVLLWGIFAVVAFHANELEAIRPQKQKAKLNFMRFVSQGQSLDMAYVYRQCANPKAETVLLLHGKNFSSQYWETTMDLLVEKGYHVLAPDQIGFGNSMKPVDYQYSFHQLAANTKKLLDSLSVPKVIVLGHSMGGMLATRFALLYPASCSKVILENPIGLEDWKKKIPYSTIDEEYNKELSKTREMQKNYMLKNYFHNEWKSEYDLLLNESVEYLNQKDFSVTAKTMALTSDMIFTQPVCYEFSDLKVPVVLIIGQADQTAIGKDKVSPEKAAELGNYPALGKKTAAAIKNCQLIELEGIGHIPHIENFKLFSESLQKGLKK